VARLDPAEASLGLAVTELVAGPEATVGLLAAAGPEPLWLGRSLHRRYQQRAAESDPDFRGEVPLALELRHGDWRIALQGRADAVRREANGALVVEELKTAGPQASRWRENARFQAAVYAWMLGRQEDAPVRCELVWLGADGEPEGRESVPVSGGETEARVREASDRWLRAFAEAGALRERWRDAAEGVRFPHPRPRPGQELIRDVVLRALEQGEQLLVEAPTGLGKTAAALAPALRFALAAGRRLLVVTSTRLQQARFADELEAIAPREVPVLHLASRRSLCAHDVPLACHDGACPLAEELPRRLADSDLPRSLLEGGGVLRPAELRRAAVADGLCPPALARLLAARAPAVVADLNHVLEPGSLAEAALPPGPGAEPVLIADEVHRLAERARRSRSVELDERLLSAAAESLAVGGAAVHRGAAEALEALTRLVTGTVAEAAPGGTPGDFSAAHDLPEAPLEAAARTLEARLFDYLGYRLATRSAVPDDPFVAVCAVLRRLLAGLDSVPRASASLVERRGGAVRLRVVHLDASPWLAPLLAGFHAFVGLSATLSPVEVQRDLLGLDPARATHLAVPSPFPPEHRRIVIDPAVRTRLRERSAEAPRIARRLARFASALPGTCLALLPSHAFLAEVASHLPILDRPVVMQRPGDDDASREAVLAALRERSGPGALVLAVSGGVFAEGADYGGSLLRGVAVVGPCLPALDPERELLREHYEERFGRGFECAYVIPGLGRVVQAAGRLLRSEADRGVIALFGRRFLEAPYREHLPAAWLDGRAPEALCGDPAAAARELFAGEALPSARS
jgi:DNA excision repair protein ERCC-2